MTRVTAPSRLHFGLFHVPSANTAPLTIPHHARAMPSWLRRKAACSEGSIMHS